MGKYLEQQYDEREYALELAKKHNLLHEDKKNMTWEELKQKAKEMGYHHYGKLSEKLTNGKYIFFKCRGNVFFTDKNQLSICFATDRTPDQMLAIMKALQTDNG